MKTNQRSGRITVHVLVTHFFCFTDCYQTFTLTHFFLFSFIYLFFNLKTCEFRQIINKFFSWTQLYHAIPEKDNGSVKNHKKSTLFSQLTKHYFKIFIALILKIRKKTSVPSKIFKINDCPATYFLEYNKKNKPSQNAVLPNIHLRYTFPICFPFFISFVCFFTKGIFKLGALPRIINVNTHFQFFSPKTKKNFTLL